ncbi:DNA-binding response regulator [Cytophagales bacterium WSM2-2]|nr:DNA-binding response regulator [Cytophagales bacterium WSM2-2]
MTSKNSIKLAIVDDHRLFRKGLISLIKMVNEDCSILFEADNGTDLQQKINSSDLPDIILMDVNMPGMDGFASVLWLTENYPSVKILIVSMVEKEEIIVRMLKLGVKGYICKDVEPKELNEALIAVFNKGYYYTDFITGKLIHSLQQPQAESRKSIATDLINDQEKQFLNLACSEMTYAEIADRMCLSPKTIDGYRNSLFEKLAVKSRVGLVLYAIKNGFVPFDAI